jgi:hypothetical protein
MYRFSLDVEYHRLFRRRKKLFEKHRMKKALSLDVELLLHTMAMLGNAPTKVIRACMI